MTRKNIFESVEALHSAFIKHCNECDCPMGCVYRRETDARILLDANCASILKCFARFVINNRRKRK